MDCGFRLAKGAHAAVLSALEEGRVTWADPAAIEEIRRDSVSRIFLDAADHSRPAFQHSTRPAFQHSPTTGTRPKVQGKHNSGKSGSVCKLYNKGTCMHDADHTNGNINYIHVCTYCRINGKSHPHPELACHKKQQNASHRVDNS